MRPLFFLLVLSPQAQAGAPPTIPVQGTLTDARGKALDGPVTLTVALYDTEDSEDPRFIETRSIDVEEGAFTFTLGVEQDLDLEMFSDGTPLFVGMTVAGDSEMSPRLPLGSVPCAAFAERAGGVDYADVANHPTLGTGLTSDSSEVRVDRAVVEGWIRELAPEPPTCAAGRVLAWEEGAWTCRVAVPVGMVMYFPGPCPVGFEAYVEAEGRLIVGTPAEGTNEATRGEALADLGPLLLTEVPAHAHEVDPPGVGTSTDGGHVHGMDFYNDDYDGCCDKTKRGLENDGGRLYSQRTLPAGNHRHDVDIPAFDSAITGIDAVDITPPYVQLTACQAR